MHTDPDNETLVANVNKGVTQLGVINHYYWYRLRDEDGSSGIHSALARFAPHDDGYLLDVSGAAVLKSSQHQQAAQALVKFLVSSGRPAGAGPQRQLGVPDRRRRDQPGPAAADAGRAQELQPAPDR